MGKKNVKYSIVVPIYNVEHFLKECIESLINQTYKNIEIILVDDGSPDKCPQLCDEYAKTDKRINVLHKKNGGLVSARKAGAQIATGDYVLCVDGDDYVAIDMVEKVNSIVDEYSPSVICFGFFENDQKCPKPINADYGFYDKQKIIKSIYPYLIENEEAKYFPNNLWGKAFRRDIYVKEQLLVDDRIKIGEDLACTKPIISKVDNLFIMPDCLYYYRTNINSMTKNKKPFDWDVPELIYNQLTQNMNQEEYDFSSQISRNVAHNVFNVAVSQFYKKDVNSKEIKAEIKKRVNTNKIYFSSVRNAEFSSLKGKLMIHALKHKNYFLMKIYANLK